MRSATVYLLIFAAMLATNAVSAKTFRFPLKRVHHNMTSQFDRRIVVQYPMKHGSMLFTINIGVGDPLQRFDLVVSTSRAEILIMDALCTNCGNPPAVPTYHGGHSRSFKDLGMSYTSGDAVITGYWTGDDFDIFAPPKINRPFVRCRTVPQEWVQNGKHSGMLGLGLHTPTEAKYRTFLDYVIVEQMLDKNLFSVRIQKGGGEHGGDITFGAVEQQLIEGPLQQVPLLSTVEDTLWLISILDVQTQQRSLGDMVVRVDTEMQYILLRRDMVQTLYYGTGAQRMSDGMWAVPDPFHYEVAFFINEGMFIVPSADMPLRQFPKYGDLYRGAIQEADNDNVGALGIPFIQNYYVVFEFTKGNENIGIGKLRHL